MKKVVALFLALLLLLTTMVLPTFASEKDAFWDEMVRGLNDVSSAVITAEKRAQNFKSLITFKLAKYSGDKYTEEDIYPCIDEYINTNGEQIANDISSANGDIEKIQQICENVVLGCVTKVLWTKIDFSVLQEWYKNGMKTSDIASTMMCMVIAETAESINSSMLRSFKEFSDELVTNFKALVPEWAAPFVTEENLEMIITGYVKTHGDEMVELFDSLLNTRASKDEKQAKISSAISNGLIEILSGFVGTLDEESKNIIKGFADEFSVTLVEKYASDMYLASMFSTTDWIFMIVAAVELIAIFVMTGLLVKEKKKKLA